MQKRALMMLAAMLTLASAAAARTHERPETRLRVSAPTWTEVEREIADEINAYRATAGLAPVPVSASLTAVAHAHVTDLALNRPDLEQSANGRPCSLHSWSARGPWTPVCWTGAADNAARMWSKPREITRGAYPGYGYEIAFGPAPGTGEGRPVTSAAALDGWRGSPLHNAVVLERGVWSGRHWRAMGVGALGGFAVVWFGDTPPAFRTPAPRSETQRACRDCADR